MSCYRKVYFKETRCLKTTSLHPARASEQGGGHRNIWSVARLISARQHITADVNWFTHPRPLPSSRLTFPFPLPLPFIARAPSMVGRIFKALGFCIVSLGKRKGSGHLNTKSFSSSGTAEGLPTPNWSCKTKRQDTGAALGPTKGPSPPSPLPQGAGEATRGSEFGPLVPQGATAPASSW